MRGFGEELTTEDALKRIESLQRVTEAALAYLDLEDLLRVLLELGGTLVSSGFTRLVLLNGHVARSRPSRPRRSMPSALRACWNSRWAT